jgi:hypothetical protein
MTSPDPILTAIAAALAQGALEAVKDTATDAVKAAYGALKHALAKHANAATQAVLDKPDSVAKQQSLAEDLSDTDDATRDELRALTAALTQALAEQRAIQQFTLHDINGPVNAGGVVYGGMFGGDHVLGTKIVNVFQTAHAPQSQPRVAPRLALLYAAPLILNEIGKPPVLIPQLDVRSERQWLDAVFCESKLAIDVRVAPATVRTLQAEATAGARVLHFSGHGVPESLVFEDDHGAGRLLKPGQLGELVKLGASSSLKLVFVSACMSEAAARAFVAAGVRHVVAVRHETPVLDSSARSFAEAFYRALLHARASVREAFDAGCTAVGHSDAHSRNGLSELERTKYLLLPEDADHTERLFDDASPGERLDLTPPLRMAGAFPARPEAFGGREHDTQSLIAELLDGGKRLITLRGGAGIGKTALATEAAWRLAERAAFRDGVVFVALRGVNSGVGVRTAVADALQLEKIDSDQQLFAALRSRETMLVLDNAEDAITDATRAFNEFLVGLLGAPGVKLLLTSRRTIGGALPGVNEHTMHVRRLDEDSAARLFAAQVSRPFSDAERASRDWRETLGLVAGNPLAIRLAGALVERNGLTRAADKLRRQSVSALKQELVKADELDGANSLPLALMASVDDIRSIASAALPLFGLMGLLPGGALSSDLDAITEDPDWRDAMSALTAYSLVEEEHNATVSRFGTFPYVTRFAELHVLSADDRARFAPGITRHLAQLSQAVYTQLSKGGHFDGARNFLAIHERNMVACLDVVARHARRAHDPRTSSDTADIGTTLLQLLQLTDRAGIGVAYGSGALAACRALDDKLGLARVSRQVCKWQGE